MESHQELLSHRRRLAAELRRLRDQAGLSGRQLAEQVGISQSKISRIESGASVPTRPEVTAWAAATRAPAPTGELLLILTDNAYTEVHPWTAALHGRSHLQGDIHEIENRAQVKLVYEPSIVPGLLQVAEYARRVFTMFQPSYAPLDLPEAVAGRLDRQVALFDPAMRFEFVITEAALRWRVAPTGVMLAQLDRIRSVASLENVSIGLIPQASRARTHAPHGFVLFEGLGGEGEALVMVETVHANLTVSEPAQVALYRKQWSALQRQAVCGAAALDLLAAVASDLKSLPPEDFS